MRRKLAIIAVVAAALLYVFSGTILTAMGSYLILAEPPRKADIGLVLAGDGRGNRILRGAELVRQGFVPQVIISGPGGTYGMYECDMAIPFAVKAGYPESYFVHFENDARSTRDEARQAIAEVRKRGAHSLLIVTSDFHTRRAARLFRREAPDLDIVMVSAPDKFFAPESWWHNREGQKTAFYEWVKTVTSWFGV